MAENKEEDKKGGIVKIAIFAVAGLVLLGVGLGIGALIFGGGSEPDPSAEVSEILEGKNPEKEKKEEDTEEESTEEEGDVEMECVENADGEEECVPKKKLPILKEAKPTPARIFRRLESSKPGSISEKARLSILPYIRNSIKNKHKVICQTN